MMHQPVDQNHQGADSANRPEHQTVIQKDEILDLLIDLETLEMEDLYAKYFND